MDTNLISRDNMLLNQVLSNHVIEERLVDLMASLPREKFVPAAFQHMAYVDEDIPLGDKGARIMLQPMILARMVQAAEVDTSDRVLLVGSGRGYAAALLAGLARQIYAVEEDEILAAKGNAVLKDWGIRNVEIFISRMADGHPAEKPYDVIFINGGAEEVPEALLDQLKDGGRLVTVLSEGGLGRVTVVRRLSSRYSYHTVCDTAARLLPGFEKRTGFVF